MTAFLRKNEHLRWVALTTTLVYLGFIDGGFLSISHLTSTMAQGPSSILNSLPLLLIVAFTLITTLLWGRVFCSSLCPFGAVQDFIARFSPKRWRWRIPQRLHDQAIYLKYALLAGILVLALVNSNISVFQYVEPFGTLFHFSSSALLWSVLLLILLACVFVERFYCRYVCPLGAALGVVALVSPLRIRRVPQCTVCTVCEHACPTGAIRGPVIDFKECVRCDICENKLIRRAGTCRHPAEEVARRLNKAHSIKIIDLEKSLA
jgi:polyferredoxin